MHPVFALGTRTGLYLLLWLPVAGLAQLSLQTSGGFGRNETALLVLPLCALYAVVCLSPWYLCRVLPLGVAGISHALQSHSMAALSAALLWTAAAKGWAIVLSRWFPGFDTRLSPALPVLFATGLLLYALSVSVHYVALSVQASLQAQARAQQAAVLAREAELKALKAQINPHFLFNSLNSISALATADPGQAREMCLRLSDFLRSTLTLGQKETISFGEELALARTYLSVEQVRFGNRLRVEEQLGSICDGCRVPPLLLQPLVENAVKHGIAGLLEGGTIRLGAHCSDGLLRLQVENDFDQESTKPALSGMGLANVRGRLLARYESRARLDTRMQGERFFAELILPCEVPPNAG